MKWMPCDGRSLEIRQYQALYSILGKRYGGNGTTNFCLPDLRGRTAIGASPLHPQGTPGGTETVTLSIEEIPSHSHTWQTSPVAATRTSVQDAVYATADVPIYGSSGKPVPLYDRTLLDSGGNLAHENRQPFIALQYIIATAGFYPDRER